MVGATHKHTHYYSKIIIGEVNTMYINPFVAGVFATILVELSILFVYAVIKMGGKR